MRRSREIGWSETEILLYELTKGDCYCNPVSTTTITTTTNPLLVCQTVMTVGASFSTYGYANVEAGYGSLNPNCENIQELLWALDGTLELYTTTCYSSLIVEISGVQFDMVYMEYVEGLYFWRLLSVSNPFPLEGETCLVNLYAPLCTTTSTTTIL